MKIIKHLCFPRQSAYTGLSKMAENNITTVVSYENTYTNLPISTVSFFGVASNILLLIAFLKDPLKCFRNSGTYLIINLSVSDCLTSLCAPFSSYVPLIHLHTEFFTHFAVIWVANASFLSITSISIDRFLMVTLPIKHRIFVKGKVMAIWIAAIWILSCLISAFNFFFSFKKHKGVAVHIIGASLVALATVMYAFTYCKLKKQSRNIALENSSESRAQEIRIHKEQKFLNTIIIIACIAFASLFPSLAFFQIYLSLGFASDSRVFTTCRKILTYVFFTNFAVNPIIYVVRLQNYRKTFYLLYYKKVTGHNPRIV